MPVVNIQIFQGRSVEQKRSLVAEVTEAICRSLSVSPDVVRILITDMPRENMGVAGVLNIDTVKK